MIYDIKTKLIMWVQCYVTVVSSAKEGKYLITEEGYAGFEIFLEIFFKGLPASDAARKVRNILPLHFLL